MKKFKSFDVVTKIGSGELNIVENSAGGYLASYRGMSGLAHVKEHGRDTPNMTKIFFEFKDTSCEDLIEKCRAEIEKRDSEILSFAPVK